MLGAVGGMLGEASRAAADRLLALFRRCISALPPAARVLLGTLFIRFVRWQVDGFWTWLQWGVWMRYSGAFAQDRRPVTEGVARIDWLWYGPDKAELVHRLTPEARYAALLEGAGRSKARRLLYVHGGGFVFASSSVLIHSVTLFCRQGFTVYSMDYPMAPEHRFPAALLSVLSALRWLRAEEGVEEVVLLGDSAGANLVSMAAAFVLNPPMMEEFAAAVGKPELLTPDAYPRIESLGLLYGLLDQSSWRNRQLKQISVVENFMAEGGIAACLELYKSLDDTFGNRLSLLDIADDIKKFPRTLFIGGSQDPLVYSTVVAHKRLLDLGFDAHCKIYPAR